MISCEASALQKYFLEEEWEDRVVTEKDAPREQDSSSCGVYSLLYVRYEADEVMDVTVSLDGTWQKRGDSSHHGIQAVLCAMMSGGDEHNEEYNVSMPACICVCGYVYVRVHVCIRAWYEAHHPVCQKNFEKSSNAMEAAGAVTLWKRSMEKFKFRYTTFAGDSDSESFANVFAENVYGDAHPIQKNGMCGPCPKTSCH
jgi:hypothetical protein